MIKVGINGYGTIGKRVADVVMASDDMVLVGATKTKPDYNALAAAEKGIPIYGAIPEKIAEFEKYGVPIAGSADELWDKCDIVVDSTPGKSPEMSQNYKRIFEEKGLKAIWQGGESHDLTGFSFNSLWSYDQAKDKQFARVVSCNTTGLCRAVYGVSQVSKIDRIEAVMIRRSADPGDSKKGPIDAIVPEVHIPSHHGPDVRTVVGDININTIAVKVPTTIMHLHSMVMFLEDKTVTTDQIIEALRKTPRVRLINSKLGFKSTAEIMEYARNLGRGMSDMYENCIWEDSIHVVDGVLYFHQAIHQESDAVPESIDCIRAMMGTMSREDSMKKTNEVMGIPG